ncbi:MAG: hypothetical protein IJX30_07435 [Clostridia bacterium]|nr:hypothetical protein [Clostridia bacterium]
MKKQKTKLAVLFLALSCASVGIGAGMIASVNASKPNVTASAETTYTEYSVSNLIVHEHSTAARPDVANASSLWLFGTGDTSDAWADYTYVSGDGIKLNGEAATVRVQDFSGGLYLSFDEVNVGDVISIGGTFVNETRAIKYNISKGSFKWNGSGWEKYVEYTEYNVENLTVHVHSTAARPDLANASSLWLSGTSDTSDAWADYTCVSGDGIKLNGEAITARVQDFHSGLYLSFDAVNVGDVISIGGVFANSDRAIKYNITERKFQWNGSAWEGFVEYTTHELGVIEPNSNSATVGAESAKPDHLYTVELGTLPVQDWDAPFVLDSGYGVKINGEEVASFEVKSTDGGLWFGLAGVQANDVISICGTFKNEKHAVKYVIEESKMVWNGSAWEKYVEYTTHEIGALKLSATPSAANCVYLSSVNGEEMPVDSWDHVFRFRQGSGTGLTLNDETLNTNDIKSPGGDLYIGLGVTVQEGDELVIGGTFYSVDFAVEYIIADSTFIFENSAWISAFDKVKIAKKEELTAYKNEFSQEDYYEAEWASFDTIIAEGVANVDAAMTDEEVEAAVAAAKAKMDEVVTKAESDAIFNELKVTMKNDLAAYKNENDYRAAEWAAIQAILAKANTEIDASESVTAINTAGANAKAEMDAVKTDAQWVVDEGVVAAAKAELAAYKSESDYKSAEWTAIQAIITEANVDIDNAIGNEEAINGIVAAAKAKMDEVKTAAQVDAEAAVVETAKAELAAYKSESDYKSAEWTEIQAIITEANGDIDEAIGDEEEINGIVAAAKAEMDKVKTAKVLAEDEVRAYYNAIDHDLYSEEAEEIISGYVAEVMAAIDNATNNEELDEAIAQFKTKVESVETLKPVEDSSSSNSSSSSSADEKNKTFGCFSSLALGGVSASVALAAAVTMLLKKKED